MPINRAFVKQGNWGFIPTPKFINFIWLENLLKIEGNHQAGIVFWKHFKCILKIRREYYILLGFVFFQMQQIKPGPNFV